MRRLARSEAETVALGRALGLGLRPGDLVLLHGELGAGKTTLVRGIARGAGFAGRVSSPTFALAHVYAGKRLTVHHLDLYRVKKNELAELGIDELLADPKGVVVVEWPEAYVRWPKRRHEVRLAHVDGGRMVEVNSPKRKLSTEKSREFSVDKSGRNKSPAGATVLCVDATGDRLSVALAHGDKILVVRRSGMKADERLLPAADAVLKRAKIDWKDLDAVAVAAGPGRFTGIRIGLAFAAAASFALEIPALAVSRLEAAADKAGGPDVLAALPGWKGEVYHQRFRGGKEAGAAEWTPAERWDAVRAEHEKAGRAVAYADTDAADLVGPARRRLAARKIPPFAPFYLKPAGYERRPG